MSDPCCMLTWFTRMFIRGIRRNRNPKRHHNWDGIILNLNLTSLKSLNYRIITIWGLPSVIYKPLFILIRGWPSPSSPGIAAGTCICGPTHALLLQASRSDAAIFPRSPAIDHGKFRANRLSTYERIWMYSMRIYIYIYIYIIQLHSYNSITAGIDEPLKFTNGLGQNDRLFY